LAKIFWALLTRKANMETPLCVVSSERVAQLLNRAHR
jgi:hypothetical protein